METRGQVGAGNEITAEEVAAADLVFVAADIDVPLDKFKGKPMYRTSTGLALKKTDQEFDKAFKEAKIFDGGNNAGAKEESREKKRCVQTLNDWRFSYVTVSGCWWIVDRDFLYVQF